MSAIENLAAVLIALVVYWTGVWTGSTMAKSGNCDPGPFLAVMMGLIHIVLMAIGIPAIIEIFTLAAKHP